MVGNYASSAAAAQVDRRYRRYGPPSHRFLPRCHSQERRAVAEKVSASLQFANRNETKHLRYGEGTLRAEPLRDALAQFERPATVISESPDEESTQAIRAVLSGRGKASAARRAS